MSISEETKSSKLEATVYYIHTCQFPNRLHEQGQQVAIEEQEQEQEKEQMVFAGVASYRFYSVLLCFYLHEQYIFFSKCNRYTINTEKTENPIIRIDYN